MWWLWLWAMCNDALGLWKALKTVNCVGHTQYVLKSITLYARVVLDTHILQGW